VGLIDLYLSQVLVRTLKRNLLNAHFARVLTMHCWAFFILYKMLDYIDNYLIRSDGIVVNKKTNKVLVGRIEHTGYIRVNLSFNKTKKRFLVHRLVAFVHIKNTCNLKYVNHKDGNKLNNRVENLEWISFLDNMKHSVKNGLSVKGKKHWKNRISKDILLIIKESNRGTYELSRDLGLKYEVIKRIKKHL
jgi:hypothetical protein